MAIERMCVIGHPLPWFGGLLQLQIKMLQFALICRFGHKVGAIGRWDQAQTENAGHGTNQYFAFTFHCLLLRE
ncbi:hypothetical protein [Chitinimonas sp.]|uniref:hypothetical protein n=1 Tax=Chitinimonas sp. TaxID=1934313 RepID=UPI0035B3FCE5